MAQATPIAAAGPHVTPLLPAVLAPPRWFRGADEQIHLVYELVLTNATTVPVELTDLALLNADDGTVVSTLSGTNLSAATSLLSRPNEPTATIPAGTVGVVWLDVSVSGEETLPARIIHQLTVHVPPGLPLPETIIETGGEAEVDRRPPVVLGPPVAGAGWVAMGSCCDGPHRRAVQAIDGDLHLAQRFAIDFNLLTPDHRLFVGDRTRIRVIRGMASRSWPSPTPPWWLASIATPTRFPRLRRSHPGECRGQCGDPRPRRRPLRPLCASQAGQCDGAGRGTRAPGSGIGGAGQLRQLHRSPLALPRHGRAVWSGRRWVALWFADFALTGQIPPLEEAIALVEAGEALPIATTRVGPRHDALPLGRDVVTFPD